MWFELVSEIRGIEAIVAGPSIREIRRIEKLYGKGRWRKLKGFADVRLPDGAVVRAEIHWYEAHGVGRRELKIKRLME